MREASSRLGLMASACLSRLIARSVFPWTWAAAPAPSTRTGSSGLIDSASAKSDAARVPSPLLIAFQPALFSSTTRDCVWSETADSSVRMMAVAMMRVERASMVARSARKPRASRPLPFPAVLTHPGRRGLQIRHEHYEKGLEGASAHGVPPKDKEPGRKDRKGTLVFMQLRTARLCLDCEEVHEEQQCPVCASESF